MDSSSLFSLVLPAGLLDYFMITDCQEQSNKIDLYLEEKESDCYDINGNKLLAHGFTEGKTIQDFPLRSKSLYLHLKRRRYYDKQTCKTVTKDLTVALSGTSLTAEFAAFLKGIYR